MSKKNWEPAARLENLRYRADWIRWLRSYFWDRGFWEVETPLLSRDTIVDRHLEPVRVPASALGLGVDFEGDWYLQTSPEFGMKRLLAAGAGRIFQVGKAFRGGEFGELHNPEFTLLEWYDAAADYEQGISFLRDLAREFFQTPTCGRESYSDSWCRALQGVAGLTVATARDVLKGDPTGLRELAERLGALTAVQAAGWDRDNLLNLIWNKCVEPGLGWTEPLVVTDWPASLAALARTRNSDEGEVAERFELYFRGVELANGYHELSDATEMAARFALNNAVRAGEGRSQLPADSFLAAAICGSPCLGTGVAAGVDRWVMMRLSASSLAEVIAFPADRA